MSEISRVKLFGKRIALTVADGEFTYAYDGATGRGGHEQNS